MTKKPKDLVHGVPSTYANDGCRCDMCRKAVAIYMRGYRKTDSGRKSQRFHANVSSRRAQLASQWIKKNKPEVWRRMSIQASKWAQTRLDKGTQ